MSHLAAQRAVVRMLFDPAFAEAARRDPETVLSSLPAELRRQLCAVDDRALRQDRLRRRRTLRTLSEEWKASTTLALAETRRLAWLEQFFSSTPFHRAIEERGALSLAYGAFLAEAVVEGRLTTPVLPPVLAIEGALAQARRARPSPPPKDDRWRAAPGVIVVQTTQGAMAALQACERYLFEVGLMPAVALVDDAPPLQLPPHDATPLHLLTVPSGGAISLVTVDAELARAVRDLPQRDPPHRALLESLADDEIVERP
jgi:hypothetical protein